MAACAAAVDTRNILRTGRKPMRALPLLLLASLAIASAFAAAPPDKPRSRGEAKEMYGEEGLAKTKAQGIDVVYARPGASLSAYKSVLIRPIEVRLRRDWKQSGGMDRLRASDADVVRIRERMSALLREEFDKDLKQAGIAQAQAPGSDVLEVELAVTDLYAAAPEIPGQLSPRSEVWALSAGSMTLQGALRDSITGETLARFYDHDTAREYSGPRRIEFGYNEIEARRIARRWAQALRAGVQAAKK
jgi:hypothetical protein